MSTVDPAVQFITLHRDAPIKPPSGQPCNGCGACCAAEPCPVSRYLLRHQRGVCPALQWMPAETRYRCGMTVRPTTWLTWLPESFDTRMGALFRRWIAVDIGCDFDASVEP